MLAELLTQYCDCKPVAMQVAVDIRQGRILKIQRAKTTSKKASSLLIYYSEDGKVPVTVAPNQGELAAALGDRNKAYFLFFCDNGTIKLGNEVYRKD